MCGFFKVTAWGSRSFSPDSIPAGFCSQKLWGFIFLALETWAGVSGVGLGLLAPKISPLNFCPPHIDVVQARSASLLLLPVWMDVVSLIP